MSILYILLALLMLGIMITVHEFGHFIVSRWCGIPVKAFSIGFGPKLIKWKSKKTDTVFSICPIPLGGYCAYYGDETDDPKAEKQDDPRAFNNAPAWKRLLSVLAGPAMNLILAFLAAVLLASAYGQMSAGPIVFSVTEGTPAAEAGLMANDAFVTVNGVDVQSADLDGISAVLADALAASPDGTLDLVMRRGEEELPLTVGTFFDETENRLLMGITLSLKYERIPVSKVLPWAWSACAEASGTILNALGKLVTTGEGFDQTAGPIGVVKVVAEQTQQYGMEMFLYLMVVLSINLGLVNLLPIPGLDGSRVILTGIEAIRGKPNNRKVESALYLVGLVLLLGLMLFFTFRDIVHLFH